MRKSIWIKIWNRISDAFAAHDIYKWAASIVIPSIPTIYGYFEGVPKSGLIALFIVLFVVVILGYDVVTSYGSRSKKQQPEENLNNIIDVFVTELFNFVSVRELHRPAPNTRHRLEHDNRTRTEFSERFSPDLIKLRNELKKNGLTDEKLEKIYNKPLHVPAINEVINSLKLLSERSLYTKNEQLQEMVERPAHYNQILQVISKYNRILKDEWNEISFDKALMEQYSKEARSEFIILLDIPEIASNDMLFKMIQDAKNRAEMVLCCAEGVILGHMDRSKYEEDVKTYIAQYHHEKELIFAYCGLRNEKETNT